MAFGKLFGQFSLQGLGKRFLKRFGGMKRRLLRQNARRRFTHFEQLEDRSLMTVSTGFGAGVLTITLNAQDDVVTVTSTSTSGNAFDITGTNLTGNSSFTGVNVINIQDTGTNTGQTVNLVDPTSGGSRFTLTGDLTLTGIENTFFSTRRPFAAADVNIGTATNGLITFSAGVDPDTIETPLGSQIYGNDVVLLGNVKMTAGSLTGVSLGNVNLNGNTLTVNAAGTINGSITGGGGLTKDGAGLLTLTGGTSNTFSGPTTVLNGELDLLKTAGNLAIGGDLFVNGGTVVDLGSEQIINTSNVIVNGGILDFSLLNITETVGPLTIASGTVLGRNANLSFGGDVLLNGGTLSGSTRSMNVAGNWLNNGGAFLHNFGIVGFGAVGLQNLLTRGLPFNQVVHNSSGTLKLNDNLTTVGNLSNGAGTLDLNGFTANANSFQVTGGTVSSSIAGGTVITPSPYDIQGGTISAILTGAVGLNKTGNGAAVLSGANTFTGPTTISAGALAINGSVTSNVTANAPGVLNGSGTIIGNVSGTGTFSPGNVGTNNGVGRLHITGNLVPTSGGTLLFDVNSPYNPANAGIDYDQFVVDGAVDLSNAKLTFANSNDTVAPVNNSLLTVISKTSAGSTVPSTNPADGTALLVGIRTFVISYNGGDGNNVVLKAQTPVVSVSVSPTGVSEIGTTNLTFTFTRDLSAGSLPISFGVTGTAKNGVDYVASSSDAGFTFSGTGGTITFANGSPTATVTIDPTPDKITEPIENVTLTLAAGSVYRVASSPANAATGQIIDNSITGIVYKDLHGASLGDPPDGIREADEPIAAGVYVYLDLNNDGKMNITEPIAQADNYGRYTFPNVAAGVYTLRELVSPGLGGITQPLTPDGSYVVSVPDGQLSGLDFGNGTGSATDYGDAPDGTFLPSGALAQYGTLNSDNGARANILPNFRLGAAEDGESDGQPSADAKGDDTHGQADEDGVQISLLPQGGSISIPVTVTNGTNGAGKLSAWIDFNQNGKFDSTERVIANRVMTSGTTLVPITIPAGAALGPTYARFRYGFETDIAPTGPSSAGEVEDYQVLVLPGNGAPTAVADTFPDDNPPELTAVQGPVIKPTSVNYHLDVLGNDIGGINSFGGPLTISSVQNLGPGTGTFSVVFDPIVNRQVVSYTPTSVAQGSIQKFQYQIQDSLGNTSSFVTDSIRIALSNNQAIDDTFTIQAGNQGDGSTAATGLPAMQNDITAYAITPTLPAPGLPTDKRPVIIAIGTVDPGDASQNPVPPPISALPAVYTQPGTGLTATLSIGADQQSLDIKADQGFLGTAIFKYEIDEDPSDDDVNTGPSTRFVTVQIVNGVSPVGAIAGADPSAQVQSTSADLAAAHYLAELKSDVVLADAGGNPTDTTTSVVHLGDTFYLRVLAKDLRDIPVGGTAFDRGVQAAYLDVLLNPGDTGNPFRNFAEPVPDDDGNPFGAIVFASNPPNSYGNGQGQNGVDLAPTAGEFNEVGAVRQVNDGLGTGYNTVFYVKMAATHVTPAVPGQPGQREKLVVAGDPADAGNTSVVLMPDGPRATDPIQVQPTDDQVFLRPSLGFGIYLVGEAEFTNPANPRDVDVDGSVTASDVLTVINSINAQGSRSLIGQTPSAKSAMVDVNADSSVTSMDVLSIINFLNSRTANHPTSSPPTTNTSTSNASATDTSLLQLTSPTGTQSSSSTTTTSPTLLTGGTSSTSSSSSSTPTNTSSSSSSTTSSTTSSTSSSTTVDPAAADDFYSSSAAQQILKRFGH